MGKSSGTTKSVSATNPATFQQPYIDKLLGESQRLYDTAGPQFFPGSTVAGFTPSEQLGQQMLSSQAYANSVNTDNLSPAVHYGLTAYNVADNPVVKSMSDAATNPIMTQLREQVLPGIRSGATLTGTQGSTRQGIAEAQGIERGTRAAMDTSAGIYGNAYQQGLNLLSNTLGQQPALMTMAYQPGQIVSGVGAQERDLAQAKINEDIARWTYNQQLPYTMLAEYGNAVSKPFGGTSANEVVATGDNTGQSIGAGLAGIGSILSIINALKGLGIG